jgi:hypothetical protein
MTLGYLDEIFVSIAADAAFVPTREELHLIGRLFVEEVHSLLDAVKDAENAREPRG